jgi:hypothetical protein
MHSSANPSMPFRSIFKREEMEDARIENENLVM